MNADQKKRIAHELSNWANVKKYCSYTVLRFTGNRMAALLQELVDAPEVLPATNPAQISSSAEPFGYFKAEPFGWTDCAETDDGAIPLYTAPPTPNAQEPKYYGWLRAVDEALVMHHLGTAGVADDYETAKKKLQALLDLNSDIMEYFSAKAPAPSMPEPLTDSFKRRAEEIVAMAVNREDYAKINRTVAALVMDIANSAEATTQAEAPADVARDSAASEPVGYLYTNLQSGEYHVSDADDDYRGPERVLWCIEPVYRRAKGQS